MGLGAGWILKSLISILNTYILYYVCTKYHFTKEGKHTNTCGGRCMRAEMMKLWFWQAYRAYVQVYTCTVATSCSSHPPAWISNWFGMSISVYQLVSPVKKFWKQYRWSMDMPGNSISCSPKLLVILWHLWMIQDCPWQHLTYLTKWVCRNMKMIY